MMTKVWDMNHYETQMMFQAGDTVEVYLDRAIELLVKRTGRNEATVLRDYQPLVVALVHAQASDLAQALSRKAKE